ncbi:RNA pseudouridine synthase [Terrihabitans rhizophilus]|uniref:RNA pseudouridine synthase n=1 Tax=Terrihabitans rhizophilus TaxID=3092662 RepID=A0ABU4RTP6_9HYPH|nr:RNA pseudouridine synthase [Terrihabitans sp. PJ23]MDX6807568.1 RNA pseudouridine synthase [Terrihabitans sp. PJ23]
MRSEDLLPRLLYRDAMMLVIDKPAGLPVHAGPKGGETLDQHFDVLRFGLPRRPELAHRLDRETSGCLVLGRHRQALAKLGKLFQTGHVQKVYLAVVRGVPAQAEGMVDLPLSKRDANRGWFMKVDHEHGQKSLTGYKVLDTAGGFSLLKLDLFTGRTHQIRVHLSALGCPVLGERIYATSPPPPAGPMLHLHSWRISLSFKPGAVPIEVEAPLPPHISATMAALGLRVPADDTVRERIGPPTLEVGRDPHLGSP